MSLYLALKLIHIAATIVAVGTIATYTYWLRRAGTDRARVLDTLEGMRAFDRKIGTPAYIVILLSGLAMVVSMGMPLTTLWIALALVLYVVIVFVGIGLYAPVRRRQRTEAARDATSASYRRAALQGRLLDGVTVTAIAVILFLMVFKPT